MPPERSYAGKRAATASPEPRPSKKPHRRRNLEQGKQREAVVHVTIYDAVASRANYGGFIRSGFRDKFKERRIRSGITRPADEILGRRTRAPDNVAPLNGERYKAMLPDNELMIAIHQYASDFYAANGMGVMNTKSMDETALIGMGLLLEEMLEHFLGSAGHLAFVHGTVQEEQSEYSEDDADI